MLSSGVAALAVVAVVGGAIALPAVQRDLSGQVETRLAAEGVDGITVHFSGRNGTVSCAAPLQDPTKAKQIIESTSGVAHATFDPRCTGATPATVAGPTVTRAAVQPATSVAGVSGAAAAASVESGAPNLTTAVKAVPPSTTSNVAQTTTRATAPSTAATATTSVIPDLTPTATVAESTSQSATPPSTSTAVGGPIASDRTVIASMLGGTIVLTGTIQSDAQRQVLDAAASTVVDPANVDDQLVVDPRSALSDDTATKLGSLIRVMARNIGSGEAGFNVGLHIRGTYLSTTSLNAVSAAAAAAGAQTNLTARLSATPDEANQLALAMSALVAERPTMFNKDGSFTASANATVDRLAAFANQFNNLSISVIGYTDSDVAANRNNQNLSYRYAAVLIGALQSKGVNAAMTPLGRGVGGNGRSKAEGRFVDFTISVN